MLNSSLFEKKIFLKHSEYFLYLKDLSIFLTLSKVEAKEIQLRPSSTNTLKNKPNLLMFSEGMGVHASQPLSSSVLKSQTNMSEYRQRRKISLLKM